MERCMHIVGALHSAVRSRAVLALAAAILLVCGPAEAGTLAVPSTSFPTIQSAIDAAVAGDTVLVSKGTYVEALDVKAKTGIVLKAAGKVVIDAKDFNTGI